jgi:hypothetical protein
MTLMLRTSSKPLVSVGTMIWEARRCGSAFGLVTAITMAKAAPSAAEVNHLCPSMTKWSPSRRAVVAISVGFEPANSGSVMEKQLRISPRASGSSHFFFCSSLPCEMRTSMLPESGAWQLNR